MLSTNQVVAVRKAIELTYNCTCNVINKEKYVKENQSTAFREITVAENQKCKLSYETIKSNNQDTLKGEITQTTKLFIAPEIEIKEGSKIIVTDVNNNVLTYKISGKPAIYQTHQEIMLEVIDERA